MAGRQGGGAGSVADGRICRDTRDDAAAGKMPHPAHKHRHTEFVMIREGTLEFDNDGKMERVGRVAFCSSPRT